MTKAEARIQKLEKSIITDIADNRHLSAISLVLCEIARQLSRIGDIYEFEIGIEADYSPNIKSKAEKEPA